MCLRDIKNWISTRNVDEFTNKSVEGNQQIKLFFDSLENQNFESLVEQFSIDEVYPDEVDLRYAANEMQNPVGCY